MVGRLAEGPAACKCLRRGGVVRRVPVAIPVVWTYGIAFYLQIG